MAFHLKVRLEQRPQLLTPTAAIGMCEETNAVIMRVSFAVGTGFERVTLQEQWAFLVALPR